MGVMAMATVPATCRSDDVVDPTESDTTPEKKRQTAPDTVINADADVVSTLSLRTNISVDPKNNKAARTLIVLCMVAGFVA